MNKNDNTKIKGYFRPLKMLSSEFAIPLGDSKAQEKDRIIKSNPRRWREIYRAVEKKNN